MTRQRAVLLVIILLAFFLRVWRLPQTPPGLWYDEAYNAMDAMWMADSGHYPPFFVGNNGREPMWHYLLLLSISLLGNIPLAVRGVGALAGILTIPVIYRFALGLLRPFAENNSRLRWLAVVASGWLAVSWWHLLNSRAGFRPVLLPPLLMLSLYFWMLGSRQVKGSRPVGNFILAGLFLGFSQYTYLPARLAFFIFGGLIMLWTFLAWASSRRRGRKTGLGEAGGRGPFHLSLKALWGGFLVTMAAAALVATPLGLFFLNNPDAFSSRTSDVVFSPDSPGELVGHLLQAASLFWGAGHELYRHHLPGRAMLGWLEIPFFWLGLLWLLHPTRLRRPETQALLLGFGVMWLPALLASPPVHALRPIGLLPFYYLIVTLGLAFAMSYPGDILKRRPGSGSYAFGQVAEWFRRLPFAMARRGYVVSAIVIALNGLINGYDYFQRWASHPQVYQEYNGPLVDLTRHLGDLAQSTDVIIPFHLYVHPTTRYLLWRAFPEKTGPPPASGRPVEMLLIPSTFQLLYVGNIPESPAMVLLTKDASGQGAAYVSRPPRAAEQLQINDWLAASRRRLRPFSDKLGRVVAQFVSLPAQNNLPFPNLFDPTPLRTADLNWANLAQLTGYDLTPQLVQPGQPVLLNLYWHSLTDKPFEYRLFLQPIDGAGQPITQWEGDAFREDMYRWRPDRILPTRHTFWLDPQTPPGPYLVRLGFFDDASGRRLPLHLGQSEAAHSDDPPLDQVQLGLFYVSLDGSDPRLPVMPLAVTFGDFIELTGVTLPQSPAASLRVGASSANLPVTFHWQSIRPVNVSYTVFLQLLNEQGELVTGWDSQPLGGLYPTNLWSPGEIIADTFRLPLPEAGLPPGVYRLIAGLYEAGTGQRAPREDGSDFALLAEFVVD